MSQYIYILLFLKYIVAVVALVTVEKKNGFVMRFYGLFELQQEP
jgi:hypothetical protein